MTEGLLLVDKPEGISSFGVVARVRKIISQAEGKRVKVGHCGTLDPAASGLMLIVIGKYTKKAGDFSKLDKTYEAEVTLGQTSTTADKEGDKTVISDKQPSENEVHAALNTFIGEIMQIPPAYSAIKIDGQRAYKMARAGKEVKIEPRKATIYSIEGIAYNYPKIKFTVSVSSGTYIRSLAEDVGTKLGTGAYLSDLRRTSVGGYQISNAFQLEGLDYAKISAEIQQGL